MNMKRNKHTQRPHALRSANKQGFLNCPTVFFDKTFTHKPSTQHACNTS